MARIRENILHRSEVIRRVESISTSRGQVTTTSSGLLIVKTAVIPANSFKVGQHYNVRGGGFAIAQGGGVINSLRIAGLFGNAGLLSSTFTDNTYNPNAFVATWWFDVTLTHDIGSPDNVGIGGIQFMNGAVKDYNVTRGEINGINFSVDNNIYLALAVNGTGAPNEVTNETFQVIEIPPGRQS